MRAPRQDRLFPLTSSDKWCVVAVFFATVFASAAGIGGGAVLVPIFTLIGGFTEHEAIPLTLATVFGASTFSTFGTYLWQHHPIVPHRHRISYDVVTVLMPMTLLGTTTGVFLNKICPNWLIMVLLVVLCAVMGRRTLATARSSWAKESRLLAQEYSSCPQSERDEATPLRAVADAEERTEVRARRESSGELLPVDVAALKARAQLLETEHASEGSAQWGALGELLRAWAAVVLLAMLKGGHGAPSLLGVDCGSVGYWATVSTNFPVLALLTFLAARSRLGHHRRRLSMGYEYVEGDVRWDLEKAKQCSRVVVQSCSCAVGQSCSRVIV